MKTLRTNHWLPRLIILVLASARVGFIKSICHSSSDGKWSGVSAGTYVCTMQENGFVYNALVSVFIINCERNSGISCRYFVDLRHICTHRSEAERNGNTLPTTMPKTLRHNHHSQ